MIENNQVKECLLKALSNSEISVEGDGYHYHITIISDEFAGLNKVKRQQKIYQALNQFIVSGELHALTIKAYTSSEMEA